MFIKKVQAKNFRLFPATSTFEVEVNVPDQASEGSGLTVFVGENGCGKTTLLDAIALPLVTFKAEGFELQDFNDPATNTEIKVLSESEFTVDGTMPKSSFQANGFLFKANIRARKTKTYLSSIVVSDQQYLKVDPSKPKDNSPDLRVAVNNPFKGKRFDENDVLILDKNRTYQTRLGTNNPTRFNRLMEDFDFQHISKNETVPNAHDSLNAIKDGIENAFLNQAIEKFEKISGDGLSLNLIDNWRPFSRGFIAKNKVNNQQIPIGMLGSGYEMIFSFLMSFYMSQQSGKQLICLIDEPELHLHPALQEKFVDVLLEFSKKSQIILTTHSPLLVKQLMKNEMVSIKILDKKGGNVNSVSMDEGRLPYFSANEINYLAFKLATPEYHNELYEELKSLKGETQGVKDFDGDFFVREKVEPKNSPWKGHPNEVSVHTYIRNQIHHPKENGMPDIEKLQISIEKLRAFLNEISS